MNYKINKYYIMATMVLTWFIPFSTATATVNPYPVVLRGLSANEVAEDTAVTAMSKKVNLSYISKKQENTSKKKQRKHKLKREQEQPITTNQDLSARIQAILNEDAMSHQPIIIETNYDIMGRAVATREQCLAYLLRNNPDPKLTVSPRELVDYYYEEAEKEGIRPDAAFAQALKETGYFRYGGTVVPEQNNYCGLGTTSSDVRGAYFPTARIGVRAHIQHLMAYATVFPPHEEIVDPRYTLVRTVYGANTITKWPGLNGRWAVPGNNYGQEILQIVEQIIKM